MSTCYIKILQLFSYLIKISSKSITKKLILFFHYKIFRKAGVNLMLNMLKLKKVLFNNFDGQKVYISSNGIISLNFFIDDARIIANNQRIILGNQNERDFIINLLEVKKIVIDKSEFKITFEFNNLQIELQV